MHLLDNHIRGWVLALKFRYTTSIPFRLIKRHNISVPIIFGTKTRVVRRRVFVIPFVPISRLRGYPIVSIHQLLSVLSCCIKVLEYRSQRNLTVWM